MNSFGTGAIFWPRLGQDLSGNAFVGPFLFSGQKNDCRKDFCMTHKMTKKIQKIKFFWKSSGFGEEASGMVSRPSGSFWSLLEWFPKMPDKNWKIEVFGEETCSVKFFHAKFVLCNVYFVVFRIFLSWRRHRTAKWIQDGKALRVTRAVNNGWRFTARLKSQNPTIRLAYPFLTGLPL